MARSHRAVDQFTSELKSVIEQGNQIIDELGKGKEEAAAAMKSRWENVSRTAREKVSDYADKASEIGSAAYEQGERAVERGSDYVRENPWRSVGVVALAAFALGLIVNSRRK